MDLNSMTGHEIEKLVGNIGRRAASQAAKAFHARNVIIDSLPVVDIYDEVRDQVWDICEARNVDFDDIGLDATEYGTAVLS